MDFVPGARGPDRQPARRAATSTTWSARSTSSAIGAVDDDDCDVWDGGRRPRRGLAPLLRDARRGGPLRPLRHPRPPRPGQGLGRGPAAARARPALLLRARGRGDRRDRHRGRGLDRRAGASRSTSSTRRRRSPRCASTRAPPSRSPPTPTCPSDVGYDYERAVETMRDWGIERDRRLRAPRAPAGAARMSSATPGRDRLRQPPLRRGPAAGARRGRDRARARPRGPLRRRRPHPRGDRRAARRRRARRPRHLLPARRGALARRRLARPAADVLGMLAGRGRERRRDA